jgi:hypothetical protein
VYGRILQMFLKLWGSSHYQGKGTRFNQALMM